MKCIFLYMSTWELICSKIKLVSFTFYNRDPRTGRFNKSWKFSLQYTQKHCELQIETANTTSCQESRVPKWTTSYQSLVFHLLVSQGREHKQTLLNKATHKHFPPPTVLISNKTKASIYSGDWLPGDHYLNLECSIIRSGSLSRRSAPEQETHEKPHLHRQGTTGFPAWPGPAGGGLGTIYFQEMKVLVRGVVD